MGLQKIHFPTARRARNNIMDERVDYMKTVASVTLLLLLNPLVLFAEGNIVPEEDFVAGNALADFQEREEQELFQHSEERAFRTDSVTLNIVTTRGDSLEFSDITVEDGMCYSCINTLVDYIQEHDLWIVKRIGHEWSDWLIINGSTGSSQRVISAPVLSPDGSRLLCAYRDIVACYNFNGVQIWRVDPDSLVLEFEDTDIGWGPANARWRGDSLVELDIIWVDWDEWVGTSAPVAVRLLSNGRWVPYDAEVW